jgi:hypothetical protein
MSFSTEMENFYWYVMAERAGFEPAVPCGTQHFQCCTIGHSVTSPLCILREIEMPRITCCVNDQKKPFLFHVIS